MPYAIFRCCVTANHLPEFDPAVDALLEHLGVEAGHDKRFGCCGYPLKNIDLEASLTASARNLALAETESKCILTTCSCCYGTLTGASRLLEDPELRAGINKNLAREGLSYKGTARVKHLLHVLGDDVGIERITAEANSPPAHDRAAVQYGCKLVRPQIPGEAGGGARFMEQLVEATGAKPVDWGLEKDCCGSGIKNTDRVLAEAVSRKKAGTAQELGAEAIVSACPFCMLQLKTPTSGNEGPGVVSLAQFLCLALGIGL